MQKLAAVLAKNSESYSPKPDDYDEDDADVREPVDALSDLNAVKVSPAPKSLIGLSLMCVHVRMSCYSKIVSQRMPVWWTI